MLRSRVTINFAAFLSGSSATYQLRVKFKILRVRTATPNSLLKVQKTRRKDQMSNFNLDNFVTSVKESDFHFDMEFVEPIIPENIHSGDFQVVKLPEFGMCERCFNGINTVGSLPVKLTYILDEDGEVIALCNKCINKAQGIDECVFCQREAAVSTIEVYQGFYKLCAHCQHLVGDYSKKETLSLKVLAGESIEETTIVANCIHCGDERHSFNVGHCVNCGDKTNLIKGYVTLANGQEVEHSLCIPCAGEVINSQLEVPQSQGDERLAA
jgi:hypothetical protein